ncbi:hypothetical protein DH2020_023189 [Rehmannia glutinosa]|uniref:RING-type E3 ubiquitin transferase n=1 Tax=Rehmannia glutinosa TaxID=99300 RepID=A0ABR0W7W9_REHGL
MDSSSSSSSGVVQEPPPLVQMLSIVLGILAVATILYFFQRCLVWYYYRPPPSSDVRRNHGHQISSVGRLWECGQDFEDAIPHIPVTIYGKLPKDKSLPPSCSREICSICLADFVVGEHVKILPRCKHMFHKDCINLWMPIRSLRCPICRVQAIEKGNVRTRRYLQLI